MGKRSKVSVEAYVERPHGHLVIVIKDAGEPVLARQFWCARRHRNPDGRFVAAGFRRHADEIVEMIEHPREEMALRRRNCDDEGFTRLTVGARKVNTPIVVRAIREDRAQLLREYGMTEEEAEERGRRKARHSFAAFMEWLHREEPVDKGIAAEKKKGEEEGRPANGDAKAPEAKTEEPKEPETAEKPETADEEREAPNEPEGDKEPEAAEELEAVEEPEEPEAIDGPEATYEPEPTEGAEVTEKPEATEEPEAVEDDDAPEEHEPAEEPALEPEPGPEPEPDPAATGEQEPVGELTGHDAPADAEDAAGASEEPSDATEGEEGTSGAEPDEKPLSGGEGAPEGQLGDDDAAGDGEASEDE